MSWRGGPRRSLSERFWERVDKRGDCWNWLGRKDKDGYGSIVRGGGNGPEVRAHRLAWEMANGPIPVGLKALHRCDNPSCVRPDHLWLGSTADNQSDMARKDRSTHGSRSGMAKLDEPTALAIKKMVAAGFRQSSLAKLHGLSRSTVNHIVRGRTWARCALVES